MPFNHGPFWMSKNNCVQKDFFCLGEGRNFIKMEKESLQACQPPEMNQQRTF